MESVAVALKPYAASFLTEEMVVGRWISYFFIVRVSSAE
jgi:hypothetical protein